MHRALCLTAALSAVVLPTPAVSQSNVFPVRGVNLIVPFSPGGSTDLVARLIAQKLAEMWAQPVVVENRPGASGMIGLAAVAKSAADGHVLGMMIVTHATTAAIQGSKGALDLVKDFTPVSQVVSQPYMLIVNPSLPARSVRELVALAKAKPGAVTFGSSGVGSVLHLAGELLAAQTRVKLTHVPYKGVAPALSDVAGGHIAMVFATRMSAQPLIASGRVRPLGITSTERVAGAQDVPTVQESGITGPFEVNGWYGISGAAGMPVATVERLNADINRVLNMADVRSRMLAEGTLPVGSTPARFGELVRSEIEKWRRIIEQAAIKPGAS